MELSLGLFFGNQGQIGQPLSEEISLLKCSSRSKQKILGFLIWVFKIFWRPNSEVCARKLRSTSKKKLKDQLSIFDEFVIYDNRIVIPKKSQPHILCTLHDSRQGRVHCKALARQGVYWMNINSDIDYILDSFELCLKYRKLPDKIELKSHED